MRWDASRALARPGIALPLLPRSRQHGVSIAPGLESCSPGECLAGGVMAFPPSRAVLGWSLEGQPSDLTRIYRISYSPSIFLRAPPTYVKGEPCLGDPHLQPMLRQVLSVVAVQCIALHLHTHSLQCARGARRSSSLLIGRSSLMQQLAITHLSVCCSLTCWVESTMPRVF